jgi:hypothetical protein
VRQTTRRIAARLRLGTSALSSLARHQWCPHKRQARLAALLLVVSACARADFYEKPFEVRLFLAVDRQSNYASTLGRQASLAIFDGASANPGAAAWREVTQSITTPTASFVDVPSGGGRRVAAAPISVRWQIPESGTFAFAYAHTTTPDAKGDDGLYRSLNSNEWIAGYGKRVGENVSVGLTLRLTNGQIINEMNSAPLGNQLLRSTTHFSGPDVSIGIATDPSPRWTVGVVSGFGVARASALIVNVNPLVVPLTPNGPFVTLPPNTLLDQTHDTIKTYALRAGGGYRLTDSTGVYFDANALHASTHVSGSESLGRFALGIEHRVGDGWAFRGGVGMDTINQVNMSAGFGYRFSNSLDVQFAFQNNASPEVNPELQRARLYVGSLAWAF